MPNSQLYMQRALQLARLGAGAVSPNPLVGCVIVHEGRIIGEGWHKEYGEAHAEVDAVNSVSDKSMLSESEVYVNLNLVHTLEKRLPVRIYWLNIRSKKYMFATTTPIH